MCLPGSPASRPQRTVRRAALLAGLLTASAPATAFAEVGFDLAVAGGTLMPWDAADEAGNLYGVSAGLAFEQRVRVALGVAGVLPDSRAQALFATWYLEGTWWPLRDLAGVAGLAPAVLVGLGLATEDDLDPDGSTVPPPRWVASGPEVVGMLGVGLTYGPPEGLYLAFDVRAYNTTHAGLTLTAGYRF